MDAARGTWALVLGRRDAAQYFDFSPRGLIGSFIALVLGIAIQAFGPHPIDAAAPSVSALSVVIVSALVLAGQYGIILLVLRQLGRADSYVPFLVAQNWATLFQSVVTIAIIALLGPPMTVDSQGYAQLTNGSFFYVGLSIAMLVVWFNLSRHIMTLRPLHIAVFLATLLGTALVLPVFLGAILP